MCQIANKMHGYNYNLNEMYNKGKRMASNIVLTFICIQEVFP